jgi:hypothetical protein
MVEADRLGIGLDAAIGAPRESAAPGLLAHRESVCVIGLILVLTTDTEKTKGISH